MRLPEETTDPAVAQRMLDAESQLRASSTSEDAGRRSGAVVKSSRCVPMCFTGPVPCDVVNFRRDPIEDEDEPARRESRGSGGSAAGSVGDSWFGWAVDRVSLGLAPPKDPKLIQAHVIFRHGQRTPSDVFFADDEEYWVARLGSVEEKAGIDVASAKLNSRDASTAFEKDGWRKQMLTSDGWDAALDLGRKLRRKYYGLLGPAPEAVVDARATDTVRTQLTTQAVVEGLAPGLAMAKKVYCATTWSTLNGQHRPFDKLLISPGPFAQKLMTSVMAHGDIRDVLEGHGDLREKESFLREALKVAADSNPAGFRFDPETVSVFLLGDSLSQRRMHGGGLPSGISAPLAHSLEMHFEDSFDRCVANRVNAVEAHGPIIRDIFACMKEDTTGRKLFLYGGHDLSILSMLRVFCVFPKPYPATLMCLHLEVYEWQSTLYLRVTYAGKDATLPCVRYETSPKGIKMCLLADVEALIFRTRLRRLHHHGMTQR